MIFKIFFWSSLIVMVYVYFFFIIILFLFYKFNPKPVQKKNILPSVSMIVCAYNEEKHIRRKIENCLEIDYPKDRLEIIVVSDGSTDETNVILKAMNNPLLKTHYIADHSGKTECQNVAVSISKNEILFFTDATTMHPPNAINLLLRSLNDSSVGCVTGRPIFNRNNGLTSKGLSMREKYEVYVRRKLSEVNTLFGATDCMYAIPRMLYIPLRADLDSGFVGPLKILERGYRTICEPEALAFIDRPAPKMEDEFIRRSRIILGGMRGLLHMRQLMNPFKFGFAALSLLSTRLLRWLSPVFLLVLFISNIFLLDSPFYLSTLLFQVGFYLIALIAFLLERRGCQVGLVFYIPLYFCILMCSATVGLKRLLAGETGQTWQTRR